MAMKKLPVDFQSLLSSSLQINNYKRVVEELVYNSLDARATSIAVRINIPQSKIQVIDNGCGITENDFDILGKKYSTSKCVDLNLLKAVPNTYGFRGQFLANLINIAQKVKITSRFEKGADTWVKIFYEGKKRDLAKTTTRPSVGTTVEVSGLFYNLHIKSKKLESLNELTEIKTLLKQLSLVHSNISITLRDDSNNEIVFKAHKNRNIYQTFGLLFNIDKNDIEELKVEKKQYKVTAYFGKKEKDVGQYHWIYLNGKYLNHCKLHKIVNDNLSKSLKCIPKRKVKLKVIEEDLCTERNIPFYVILLSCPYYDYDMSDLSKHVTLEFKNWQDITNILKKLVMFYSGHGTLNKELKHETTTNMPNKPKEVEVDTRVKVRKIVEKLLKSNSKQPAVSQMQNGIKGKSRRRMKKRNSSEISLSKVIPSKKKTIRQPHKKEKIELSEDILLISKISEAIAEKKSVKEKNESDPQIKQQNFTTENYNTTLKHSSERKNRCKDKSILACEKKSFKVNVNSVDRINIKKCGKKKTKKHLDKGVVKNENTIVDINNHYNKKQTTIKENNVTTICNIYNSNKQIKLHEKIKDEVVYDYVPHPLNSTQCCYLNHGMIKEKENMSSRDLVKTILNTQSKYVSFKDNISINHEEHEPKQWKMPTNIENVADISTHCKYDQIQYAKNTRESTFNAWDFDLQSESYFTNKLSDDRMFVSRLTFQSHQYNNNNKFNNNIFKPKLTKTEKFITKQSKENFVISIEKQKTKNLFKNKLKKHQSTFKFGDISMSFGIKNFFNNRNVFQESSFKIDFSNTSSKNSSIKANYLRRKNNIRTDSQMLYTNLNTWQTSHVDNEFKADFVNTEIIKSTYTIDENSFTKGKYTRTPITQPNNKYLRNAENMFHETYTIETNSETGSYQIKNYYNGDHDVQNTKKRKGEFNVVFISEPKMQRAESSTDKTIEPVYLCETILNESNSQKSITDREINLGQILTHDISQLSSVRNIHCRDSKKILSLREISHHFNTNIRNLQYITTPNKSQISYVHVKDNNLDNLKNNNKTINNNDLGECIIEKLPEDTTANDFSIKNRPKYMPKGMSQIFENCNTKGVCEYNLDEEYYKHEIYKDFTNEVEINTEIFKPRIDNAKDTTKAIEKVNTKLHKENSSLTFDGRLLQQAQVLGQIDDKFIAAVVKSKSDTDDFLVLFDQHAVHERIRLENNLSDYFNGQEWKSVKLDVFLLKLNKDEILYLHNYKEKFTQLGLAWDILNDNEVSVFSIPEAMLGKNPRQVEKIMAAVKNLILEEINSIKLQGGCISLHPRSIMDLVFSEACRYAIKFGDKLTISECKELIQSLSDCKTPFQCAHGRPVMAVLMEITSDDVPDYKVDSSKILLFSKTHHKQTMLNLQ